MAGLRVDAPSHLAPRNYTTVLRFDSVQHLWQFETSELRLNPVTTNQ